MATLKQCDRCKVLSTGPIFYGINTAPVEVRAYRFMALMDKDHYKHDQLIKLDLCNACSMIIQATICDEVAHPTDQ